MILAHKSRVSIKHSVIAHIGVLMCQARFAAVLCCYAAPRDGGTSSIAHRIPVQCTTTLRTRFVYYSHTRADTTRKRIRIRGPAKNLDQTAGNRCADLIRSAFTSRRVRRVWCNHIVIVSHASIYDYYDNTPRCLTRADYAATTQRDTSRHRAQDLHYYTDDVSTSRPSPSVHRRALMYL